MFLTVRFRVMFEDVAVAEYRAQQLTARIVPDTVRRLKDSLLKVPIHQNENANYDVQFKHTQALYEDAPGDNPSK